MERYGLLVATSLLLGGSPGCDVGVAMECDADRCDEDGRRLHLCRDFREVPEPIVCSGVCRRGGPSGAPVDACVECSPGGAPTCSEGATAWRACNLDGSWGAAHPCSPPLSVCWEGSCRACDPTVTPTECIDDVLYRCVDGSHEQVERCVSPTGTCTADGCKECDPGGGPLPLCVDGRVAVCTNGLLTGGPACPSDRPHCIAGTCVECSEESRPSECMDGLPAVCGPKGEWVAGSACEAPTAACLRGRCVACDPNAVNEPRCFDDSAIAVCSESGEWVAGTACSGLACWSGRCVECNPSLEGPRCQGECSRSIETCDAGTWQVSQTCEADVACSRATCQTIEDRLGTAEGDGTSLTLVADAVYSTPLSVTCASILKRFLGTGTFEGPVQFALYRDEPPFDVVVMSQVLEYPPGEGLEPNAIAQHLEPGPYRVAMRLGFMATGSLSRSAAGSARVLNTTTFPDNLPDGLGAQLGASLALSIAVQRAPP